MDSTFQAVCETAAAAWEVPALAAGSSVGGRVETAAVGCADDALFRVASVTKPFTATLGVDLLGLDEASGVWAPDVRVRHLLAHTSGYDCECGDVARFGEGDGALAALAAELPSVRRLVGLEHAWSYANSGYWLVGWLAAERSGRSFEDALLDRVIRPAGLEATSFGEPDLAGTGANAVERAYPRARRPSGGLVSNVPDLLRFGDWQLASPAAARLRVVHGKPAGGVYGLGLHGERVGGVEVWGHSGSYGGFQSSFLLVPDRDAVFAGVTNSGRGKQALREVEDAFFERVIGERRRVAATVELPHEALERFAGSYANSDEEIRVAVSDGGGLSVTFPDGEHAARSIGGRKFEVVEGERSRDRFDFPLEGFGRFGSRLAERVDPAAR
jgi:CubicO group peptidase (beta-lactamase class C family)